jgi:hypothetical protein
MKPNTNLYVYFDNVNVSNICLNLTTYVGSWTESGGNYIATDGSYVYIAYDGSVFSHRNNWGGQITSDSYGNVYGIFKIPSNVFKSGELEFKLTDIANLQLGESAVTTQATYIMFCSVLSIEKQPLPRPPQVINNITNVTNVTNVTNTVINYTNNYYTNTTIVNTGKDLTNNEIIVVKPTVEPTQGGGGVGNQIDVPPKKGKQFVPDYLIQGFTAVPGSVGVAVDNATILTFGDRRPVVGIDSAGYIQVSGFTETWNGGGSVYIDYEDPNNIYTGWGNPDLTYYYY